MNTESVKGNVSPLDAEIIKSTLAKYFHEVKTTGEDKLIFKCNRYYCKNVYQIYYVDYSLEWKKDDFNVEDYLEKYISDTYYANPGFLQWNFYLILLNDLEIAGNDLISRISDIEKNETYCRKYVINIEQLDKWLDQKYRIEIEKEDDISEDLASLWINKLQENDMDCVFLKDISYTDGVNAIIEGKPIKQSDTEGKDSNLNNKKSSGTSNEDIFMQRIPYIKKLTLESYRKFPAIRDFEFGRVNIFTGQNGTGKTSVLEAIELLLCGKNYRNQEAQTDEVNIYATFEGLKDVVCNNCANKTFKKREEFWYNKPQNNGINKLCVGFNRYNFFNTDASFEFANEKKNEGDINKAFEDIALGENVNYVESKMLGYKDRLKKEKVSVDKLVKDYTKVISNENQTLKNIDNELNNPTLIFNEFIKRLKNINWIRLLPNDIKGDFSTFENDYIIAENSMDMLLKSLGWINEITIKNIILENDTISNLIDYYRFQKQVMFNYKNELLDINKEIKKIYEIINLLNEYKKYEDVEINSKVVGIGSKISKLHGQEILYRECLVELERCDLSVLPESNDNIEVFVEKVNQKLKTQKTKYQELEKQTNAINRSLTQLEKIITDIKAMGKQVLNINAKINKCPLCNTPFENDELRKRIEDVYLTIENAEVLENYVNELEFMKLEIQKLNNQLYITDKIKIVFSRLHLDRDLININQITNFIDFIKTKAKDANDEYEKWIRIREQLMSDGIYEDEYNQIKRNLYLLNVQEINTEENLAKYDVKLKELSEREKELTKTLNSIEMEINNRIQQYLESNHIEEFDGILNDRYEKISKAKVLIREINKYIALFDNENIWAKRKGLKELYELFCKFKEEKAEKDKVDVIKIRCLNTIKEYQAMVGENRIIYERIDKSLNVLDDLLINHSKSNYLQEFIGTNREKIVKIFTEIHSPKEFTDIFFTMDSNIILKRIETGETADLKSISTGQRSALALAVFLCLNQKLKNGPPYLIFDDPIAFIDDMNVLSFIDYIREIIISTDRQIFFATANENLVFLLRQKFAFLDENELKIYKFDREDTYN